MLVFAPLFRGGNRPWPLLVLEAAAIAALALLAWPRADDVRRPAVATPVKIGIALLAITPLLQLVPLPAAWWAALPGHDAYFRALELGDPQAAGAMRPASIHPRATQYAALALLPCFAVFFLTLSQSRSRIRAAAMIFVGVAVAEAILGVMQLGASRDSLLYLGNPHGEGTAVGTYVNRNHFASLMAMALPMAVALWALETVAPSRGEDLKPHPRHADRRVARGILLSMLVLLLVVALFFTRSRAGIAAGLSGLALATLALVWRGGSAAARAAFAAVGLATLGFAAYIGLTPVLDRFAPEAVSLGYEGRVAIARSALEAAVDFLPLGSGLGTFGDVFRRYQVAGLGGFVEHAHNDYIEAFLELGVAGIAVTFLFAAAYAMRWIELARRRSSRSLGYLQLAAGFGMAAMFVHAAFDFNFHIPANAIYFSFLAGVFFATPSD